MEDYLTIGTCAGDSTAQDEDEETAPSSITTPRIPGQRFFPCIILITEISLALLFLHSFKISFLLFFI